MPRYAKREKLNLARANPRKHRVTGADMINAMFVTEREVGAVRDDGEPYLATGSVGDGKGAAAQVKAKPGDVVLMSRDGKLSKMAGDKFLAAYAPATRSAVEYQTRFLAENPDWQKRMPKPAAAVVSDKSATPTSDR